MKSKEDHSQFLCLLFLIQIQLSFKCIKIILFILFFIPLKFPILSFFSPFTYILSYVCNNLLMMLDLHLYQSFVLSSSIK